MKLKPYPEYKDSGVEWIGDIPVSWGIFKLKHVINEFISGGTPNSDNEKFWVQNEEDGVPWVAIGDMTNNEVVEDTKKKITFDGLANKKLRILKSGTLIYSIFASLGKVSLLGIDATTNQAILGLITNEKIDGIFLKYYLRYLEKPIIALSNANTQNNLNSTIVKNIEFSLPNDYNDQIKIASFLDKKTSEIDLTIEKDTRLIELLKEKRTALINHVVTKGLDSTVKMKDSGVEWIGEIPESWEIGRMGADCTVKARLGWRGLKASEYVNEGYIFLSTPNIKNNEIDFENVNYITPERYFESPEIMLDVGDVLLAKDGSTLGISNVVRYLPVPATVNSSIAVIKPKNGLNSVYLHYFISSAYMQNVIQKIKDGMGVPHLFQADIRKFTIFKPPIEEQYLIASYIDQKTAEIGLLIQNVQNKINLVEEYKKSLIHHVVTGKMDVREVAV